MDSFARAGISKIPPRQVRERENIMIILVKLWIESEKSPILCLSEVNDTWCHMIVNIIKNVLPKNKRILILNMILIFFFCLEFVNPNVPRKTWREESFSC